MRLRLVLIEKMILKPEKLQQWVNIAVKRNLDIAVVLPPFLRCVGKENQYKVPLSMVLIEFPVNRCINLSYCQQTGEFLVHSTPQG